MIRLSTWDQAGYEPWREAVSAYNGVGLDGSGWWDDYQPDLSPEGFTTAVARRLRGLGGPARKRVPCTYFLIRDGEGATAPVLGFLALRHELNELLLEVGGHIGYSVRPDRRREGTAKAALALALTRAGELGLERVLVTCDETNVASARTIEANGGQLGDTRKGRQRYWISL